MGVGRKTPFGYESLFQYVLNKRLCHITWLIFDGKILRNTSCFVRLQTTEGSLTRVELASLKTVFFASSDKCDLVVFVYNCAHLRQNLLKKFSF